VKNGVGEKPKTNCIQQFGTVANMLVPAENMSKLDELAKKLTFAGYHEVKNAKIGRTGKEADICRVS
jgi:hypothetical protein